MTKSDVITVLKKQLGEQVALMKSVLADSKESATGDEAKPEGKYDTQAIEAAYLAQAQEEQLTAAEEGLLILDRFDPPTYEVGDEIGPGTLVEVDADGEISFYLLAPAGGGLVTDFLGCDLTVITPDSRLYQELVGKKMSDTLTNPTLTIMGLE